MRKGMCYFFLICLVSCRPSDFVPKEKKPSWHGEALPNSFLVSFCPDAGRTFPVMSSFHDEGLYFEEFLNQFRSDARVKAVDFLLSAHRVSEERHSVVAANCAREALTRVDFFELEDAFSVLGAWQKSGRIQFWEPNWLSRLSQISPVKLATPYLDDGWRWWTDAIQLVPAMEAIKAIALANRQAVESPVLAVLDSGVDFRHPSLVNRIWHNEGSENSPCPDDYNGCDTVNPPRGLLGVGEAHPFGTEQAGQSCESLGPGLHGDCIHGTHIAGILAGDIESGVPGVCPFCRIMNVRVLENVAGEGRVPDSAILRALKYVSLFERSPGKNLVRVVNLSFGKYQKGKAVSLFIEYLSKHRDGILVFAAAGNEDSQKRVYPAAHAPVLAIAGLAASGRKASYSNYGPWVNIAAPGGEMREGGEFAIESSVPGGGFAFSQGTSMATPVVAGVAGLVLAIKPDLSLDELRKTLLDAANPRIYHSSFAEGYNFRNYYPKIENENVPLLGVGMIDASAAVRGIKRQESELKRKERIRLDCAHILYNGGANPSDRFPFSFFLVPLLFLFCLRWIERIGIYVRQGKRANSHTP